VERAVRLGWPRDRIQVIDNDLGKSGASSEQRLGFQFLIAEVGLGRAGLVITLPMLAPMFMAGARQIQHDASQVDQAAGSSYFPLTSGRFAFATTILVTFPGKRIWPMM